MEENQKSIDEKKFPTPSTGFGRGKPKDLTQAPSPVGYNEEESIYECVGMRNLLACWKFQEEKPEDERRGQTSPDRLSSF